MKVIDPWAMGNSLTTHTAPKLTATQSRNGQSLTVTAQDTAHFTFLQSVSQIGEHLVCHRVVEARVQGLIWAPELDEIPIETLAAGWLTQGVRAVYRPPKGPKARLILTFALPTLPKRVTAVYLSYEVKAVIPRPRRCSTCCKYGHQAAQCRGKTRCSFCTGDHARTDCQAQTPTCPACKGPHPVEYKECPEWKRQTKIQELIAQDHLTPSEARKRVSADGHYTPPVQQEEEPPSRHDPAHFPPLRPPTPPPRPTPRTPLARAERPTVPPPPPPPSSTTQSDAPPAPTGTPGQPTPATTTRRAPPPPPNSLRQDAVTTPPPSTEAPENQSVEAAPALYSGTADSTAGPPHLSATCVQSARQPQPGQASDYTPSEEERTLTPVTELSSDTEEELAFPGAAPPTAVKLRRSHTETRAHLLSESSVLSDSEQEKEGDSQPDPANPWQKVPSTRRTRRHTSNRDSSASPERPRTRNRGAKQTVLSNYDTQHTFTH